MRRIRLDATAKKCARPILPVSSSLRNQLDISLMHEGSWQSMVSPLASQVAYSQAMKLPVNDRNELAGGFLIAICQLFQQRGYVGGTGSTLCLPKPFELSPRAVDDILLQF